MRSRRSSTSARASGLWKGRCGRVTSTGWLLPVLPETLVALSVIVTLAPAHGCSERSIVALASPVPVAVAAVSRPASGGWARLRGAFPDESGGKANSARALVIP